MVRILLTPDPLLHASEVDPPTLGPDASARGAILSWTSVFEAPLL